MGIDMRMEVSDNVGYLALIPPNFPSGDMKYLPAKKCWNKEICNNWSFYLNFMCTSTLSREKQTKKKKFCGKSQRCKTTMHSLWNISNMVTKALYILRILVKSIKFFVFIFVFQVLLQNASSSQAEQLQSGYKLLTSSSEMGEKFKFFSLVQHGLPEPAAFRWHQLLVVKHDSAQWQWLAHCSAMWRVVVVTGHETFIVPLEPMTSSRENWMQWNTIWYVYHSRWNHFELKLIDWLIWASNRSIDWLIAWFTVWLVE